MRCPVLVSRADEMSRLREGLRLPADGRGGLWVVRGEPGVGKSRVVAALAEEAGRADTVVMSGRAVRAAAPVPLRPLAEALLAWLRTGSVPEDRRLAPYLPALGRLAPQLGAATDDGASSVMLIGEGLLRLAAALGGVLLVVEDLHWADPETLGVLEYVADNAREVPLLVVATMRPHDTPAVTDLVEDLRGRGSAGTVDLEPLGEHDVEEMLRACLGAEPPDGLDQLVRRFSAGYPLLVEEVLADLHASGAIVRDADGWLVRGELEVSVPPSFVRSVRSRLDAVSAEAREVMEAAALLGMQFDWQVVGGALGLDDRTTGAAIRELATERLVVAVGDGFEIRHALTREAVLEGLLPPDRRRLAAALARAVELRAESDGSAAAHQVLAELFESAGDRARAAEHWLSVGRASIATGALTSALAALERAGRLVFPSTEVGLDVREAVVEAHALAGDVPAALEVGESLIAELADRADDPDRLTALRLRLARALLSGGRWDEAEAMLDAAAGRDAALDDVLAARLALGRYDDDRAAERARAALAEVGPGRPEVACEAWEILGRAARRDVLEATAAFEEGYRLADEHGLVLWRCRLLAALGALDLAQRRPSPDRLVAARKAALAAGAIATAARAELDLQMVRLQYYRLDEAAASLDNAITMMERLRIPDVGAGYGIRAVVNGLAGRTGEMEADIAAMERTVSNEALLAIALPAHVRAVHALGHGRYDEALEWLGRAMEGSRRYPGFPLSFRGYWALLETVLRGDGAAAREEVRTGPQASSPQNRFGLRCADAVALGRRGEREEAEKVFADAEWALPGDEPWLEVHARLLVARAAAADGWGEPEQWFRSVLDALVGFGQTEAASACRVAMRDAGFAVPRRAVGSDRVPPHLQRIGVTAREHEVLELVVAGLPNKEIAERLYLSVRTVETHVARLLQRTGASERGELGAHLAGESGESLAPRS